MKEREPLYIFTVSPHYTVNDHRYDTAGNTKNGIDHPCTVPEISEKTESEIDHGSHHHNAAADDTDFFTVFVGLRIVVMH